MLTSLAESKALLEPEWLFAFLAASTAAAPHTQPHQARDMLEAATALGLFEKSPDSMSSFRAVPSTSTWVDALLTHAGCKVPACFKQLFRSAI